MTQTTTRKTPTGAIALTVRPAGDPEISLTVGATAVTVVLDGPTRAWLIRALTSADAAARLDAAYAYRREGR